PAMRAKDGVPPGIAVELGDEAKVPWDRATVLVRFHVDSPASVAMLPNTTGSLKLATRLRNAMAIPYSAVRPSPDGPYVFAVADDRRTLTKRGIVMGNAISGLAAIVSGLRPGERVAATGTFFLEAEATKNERSTL